MSSKPCAATPQTQALIAAINGMPRSDIARAVGIDAKTLRKFYRKNLNFVTQNLCATVVHNLGRIVTGNGSAAVNAAKYILGCKAGWRDSTQIQIKSERGIGLTWPSR